jgi:putative nucleotidyltransferase with HDIG domain
MPPLLQKGFPQDFVFLIANQVNFKSDTGHNWRKTLPLNDRKEALNLLNAKIRQPNLIKHCLATEAIMRALARRLGTDVELWGLTGLLHDLDLEQTRNDQREHARIGAEILKKAGFPEEGVSAILAHNGEVLGIERHTPLEHALACAETVTGLIVATALVQAEKKLASVKPDSVIKRMKEKRFAQNVNREIIRECENLGLELDDFIRLSLEAMQGIADELGL